APPSRRELPRQRVGAARAAAIARWVLPCAAFATALEAKLAARAEREELGAGAHRLRHHAAHRSRANTTMLPSPKSPQPVTQPSSASATCAPPASPRS